MKRYGCLLMCWSLLTLTGGCVGFTCKNPCYLPEQVVEVKGLGREWSDTDLKESTVSLQKSSYVVSGGDKDNVQLTFFHFENTVFVDVFRGKSHVAFPAVILGNAFWTPHSPLEYNSVNSEYAMAKSAEIEEKVQLLQHEKQENGEPFVTASTEDIQQHLLTTMIDDLGSYLPIMVSKSELPVTSSGLLSRNVRTRNYFQLLTGLIRLYGIQEENTKLTDKEYAMNLYHSLSFMTGFDPDEAYALFGERSLKKEGFYPKSIESLGDVAIGVHEDVVHAAKLYREAFVVLYSGDSFTEVRQKFIAARRAYLKAQKIVKELKRT